VTLSC